MHLSGGPPATPTTTSCSATLLPSRGLLICVLVGNPTSQGTYLAPSPTLSLILPPCKSCRVLFVELAFSAASYTAISTATSCPILSADQC
ncbi:hypothetical protein L209DRAFT_309934 [Thermothelomyces heterothallicus CBS 203.75]